MISEEERSRSLARSELDDWRLLEELFDHRFDGLVASRRFEERLTHHWRVWGDRTAGKSRLTFLQHLEDAERELYRQRGIAERRRSRARRGQPPTGEVK